MDRSNKSEKFLTTGDLNVAAFLCCRGHSIQEVIREGSRVIFRFADAPEISDTVLAYFNGATVPAREYSNILRDLKGLTHQAPSR
jgi:hypothetical protein